tara:strand:- start:1270 stop:2040 length:771 start_codon:yes stop_codon:yes gene_type:complete
MITRRLTKIQKEEIVEAYRGGERTNILAEKYSCSANTINRTVKNLLSDIEYDLIKEQRLKSSNKKLETVNNKNIDIINEKCEQLNSFNSLQSKVKKDEQPIKNYDDFPNSGFEEIAFLPIRELSSPEHKTNKENNNFEEIFPLTSNFNLEKNQLDFEILNQENLPECVYMLVDKKVELEVKSISDLPEWSFLPENELNRNAILLFSNQRTAKRSCSKNQRVIKIPNTNVFQISKSHLVSKGITRLILEDSIIALDN